MPIKEKGRNPGKQKKSKGKILFVEDDKFLAEMFRQKFVIEGYEPLVAYTAITAVLALKEEKPIAIILDIVLKDSECWMIMEYLLRKKDYQPVPIILLTNYGAGEYRKKAKELKADAFYIKTDITPSELVHAMEELIRKQKNTKREPYRSPIL
jgi:DNA-binding response OmpR family regulator